MVFLYGTVPYLLFLETTLSMTTGACLRGQELIHCYRFEKTLYSLPDTNPWRRSTAFQFVRELSPVSPANQNVLCALSLLGSVLYHLLGHATLRFLGGFGERLEDTANKLVLRTPSL